MRKFAALFATFLCTVIVSAQVPGDTLLMNFDDASDQLHLDSIYPASCWQVGHPNKVVFTSAYSEPNALVTDTLLPHQDSTTCYAEYTLTTSGPGYGMSVGFKYRIDTDSLDSYGWIEQFDSGWVDADFNYWIDDFHPTWVGDRYAYTGRSPGWHDGHFWLGCLKFLPLPDTMHVRFAFHGGNNPSHRDGWMIDDVNYAVLQCDGSIAESSLASFRTSPNPMSNFATLKLAYRKPNHSPSNSFAPMAH